MRRICYYLALLLPLSTALHTYAEIHISDSRGKVIRLQQPAQKVIALAPHIVENVFSAGAGDKLIAAVNYSDYPAAARALPQVGGFNNINIEAVIALEPDLVLGWASGNGPAVAEQLERLGIKVYMDEPRTLEDIAAEVVAIGEMTGTQATAQPATQQWLAQLAQLRASHHHSQPLSVFYQVWNEPLQTLNGQHLVSDVIRLCGGENVFNDALSIAPKISIEAVLSRNPDAIVASGMGQERPEWLDAWKKYPKLTAVAEGNLFFVPPDLIQRHTLRILDGTRLMCDALQQARQKTTRQQP